MKKFLSTNLPKAVRIVEVGPRDGLQNESIQLTVTNKIQLIKYLINAGLTTIEAGSFVSSKWVPQMNGSEEIISTLINEQNQGFHNNVMFTALTPNMKGFESALKSGVKEIAVFGAASESFSLRNINCSIDESINRFESVCKEAIRNNIRVRGYVSCVLGCPYEGKINPQVVKRVTKRLLDLGCYEVSLGDTIGIGTPGSTSTLLDELTSEIPSEKLAVHFHDTYGQALANILVALQYGINVIDSSISGLGGCPYAAGASGNVATEDVVYMLQGLNISTNIELSKLIEASVYIDTLLNNRKSGSKYTFATIAERNRINLKKNRM